MSTDDKDFWAFNVAVN